MPEQTVRPTKKQREILSYIEQFIGEHGYSPSYREIMKGLNYGSVATVALHVNNLIARGHLVKRENSARSIELTLNESPTPIATNNIKASEEKWLVKKVEYYFARAESETPTQEQLDELYVLIGALKVLGLDGAAHSFIPRLSSLRPRE
jgi:repressor LexA